MAPRLGKHKWTGGSLVSEVADYVNGEPPPIHNDGPSMHDLVVEDMRRRKEMGLRKYGTILQAGNGRNALQDAYEEVLDLAVYLRQRIEEDKT